MEEEEGLSDGEPETKKKKSRKEFVDSSGDSKREMTVTTCQEVPIGTSLNYRQLWVRKSHLKCSN
uniref:Uncharacterized protein n=1 Tax=Vitis vinifera TaxID=29760 RepID=F6HZT8_VITVI